MSLTIGSLFAGIGGFDLAARWVGGFETRWFVEIDAYCQRVLKKHWPNVPCHENVERAGLDYDLEFPDILCGGFPCQPVSVAGQRKGQEDERWLWPEYARLVRQLRPKYVIVENVPGLLDRGMGDVLSDLAGEGYDAEWEVLSACAFGASHVRRRLFIVAHTDSFNGWPRLWHPFASQSDGPLQSEYGSASARDRWRTRLANPSALYGGADGIPNGMERNHAIGNAIAPACAVPIFQAIKEAEGLA